MLSSGTDFGEVFQPRSTDQAKGLDYPYLPSVKERKEGRKEEEEKGGGGGGGGSEGGGGGSFHLTRLSF